MIIPRFSITQDKDFLYINIELKYAKITSAQFEIDGYTFFFYLKPYFLKLTFAQPRQDENTALNKATYDIDKQLLFCKVQKLNSGEEFSDLNMITKLLTPSSLEFQEPQAS